MIEDDSTYFTKRAGSEMAQRAARPGAAQVHQEITEVYFKRVKPEARPAIEQAT
jgi:hypothetical protein